MIIVFRAAIMDPLEGLKKVIDDAVKHHVREELQRICEVLQTAIAADRGKGVGDAPKVNAPPVTPFTPKSAGRDPRALRAEYEDFPAAVFSAETFLISSDDEGGESGSNTCDDSKWMTADDLNDQLARSSVEIEPPQLPRSHRLTMLKKNCGV